MVNFQKPFFTDPSVVYPNKDHEIGMPSGTRVQSASDKDLMAKRSKDAPIRTLGDIVKALNLLGFDSNGDKVRVYASGGVGVKGDEGTPGTAGVGYIDAEADFGIVADSTFTTNGTDNGAAIRNLIVYLAANPGVDVIFPQDPKKVIGYTGQMNFRFMNNSLLKFGSPVRNVGVTMDYQSFAPWFFGCDPFVDQAPGVYLSEDSRVLPIPINTAFKDDESVTLIDPTLATKFAPGDWALVCGYDLQAGGYPPNLRVFERLKVQTVDLMTGEITFLYPLKNSYYSDWYSYAEPEWPLPAEAGWSNVIGPAGIIPLNRPNQSVYADSYTVENFKILPNLLDTTPAEIVNGVPRYGSSAVFFFGGHHIKLINCEATEMILGGSELIEAWNPRAVSFNGDKLSGRAEIYGGHVVYPLEFYGFEHVAFHGTTVAYYGNCNPTKTLWWDRCIFTDPDSGTIAPVGFRHTQSVKMTENIFAFTPHRSLIGGWPVEEDVTYPDRPGKFSVQVLNSGTTPAAINPTTSQLCVAFGDGTFRILVGPGTILKRVSDKAEFVVQNVRYVGNPGKDTDPNSYFVVDFEEGQLPVVGDVLWYYTANSLYAEGNVRAGGHDKMPLINDKRYSQSYVNPDDGIGKNEFELVLTDLPQASVSNNFFDIDGYVTEIEVNVVRVYSGTGGGAIRISAGTPVGNTVPQNTINSKILGTRIIKTAGSIQNNGGAAASGDTIVDIGYSTYFGMINIRPEDADQEGRTAARYTIKVRGTKRP